MANLRPVVPPAQHQQLPPVIPGQVIQPPREFNPQFIRALPVYKSGGDLDLYLRRFEAYARAVHCPENERSNLLISLLDDKALTGISRAMANNPRLPYPELTNHLRRAEGYTQNREKYITDLRSRKRLRGEGIWEYHLDLYRSAERAYPDNEAMKTGSLRESFIANINDTGLGARLRERPDLGMEQLLDLAIMLYECQTASTPRQVNFIEETKEIGPSQEAHTSLSSKIDSLSTLMENMALNKLNQQKPQAHNSAGPENYHRG